MNKKSSSSLQNQYKEINIMLFEIVHRLVYRIQMQTSLWNFLKQGTTHKLVLRGMFHSYSEFLFFSHDDYGVIIIKSISFRYCAVIPIKAVQFFCKNHNGLELQQNTKNALETREKRTWLRYFHRKSCVDYTRC